MPGFIVVQGKRGRKHLLFDHNLTTARARRNHVDRTHLKSRNIEGYFQLENFSGQAERLLVGILQLQEEVSAPEGNGFEILFAEIAEQAYNKGLRAPRRRKR